MWMMFRVVPIMWRAVRPSKVVDMPAVVNSFWMRKGFEGLTIFGQILTPNQSEADNFNRVVVGDLQSPANEWRKFAKMSIKERLKLYEQKTPGA